VGHDWKVETIVDPGASPAATPPAGRAAPEPPSPRPPSPPPAAPSDTPAAEPVDKAPARPDEEPDQGARPDDTDAESGLDGAQLLQEALGAQVIQEIPHQ
jgi:DNA polymerase-3 subunit gamma/tau